MNKKVKILLVGLIAVLFVLAVISVVRMNMKHDVMKDISEMKELAASLYAEGDIEGAINKMNVYCAYVTTDIDAKTELGDWYLEMGNEEKALENYYDAANNKELIEEVIPALSVKNTQEIVLEAIDDVVIEITPDVRMTKDMTLVVTGHNLVPEKSFSGRIDTTERRLFEDENYLTTDWFAVDSDGEYLTMSGGFNCAMWQFANEMGEVTHYAVSGNVYRVKDTFSVNVYQMARAAIPENAAWCRVTYFDNSRADMTASLDENLTIVYGRLPGESRAADYSYYQIPDLKEGDSIVYKDNTWSMIKDGVVQSLDGWKLPTIERGSYIAVGGTMPGKVSFDKSTLKSLSDEGIYTVRFDKNNPSAMGERLDDAKNLGFNAAVAEGTIALGENHFDSIYPWSDIKLCNIVNGEVVAYEGDSGFASDGTNGDVFVEVPKFYVKRVADEFYDTISISGVCHEGFEIDSAFLGKNGELDKVYVAAYITSVDDNKNTVSVSGTSPVFTLAPDELAAKAEAKGEGYGEIDYATLSMLQKLFMVETGLRNSQYLYLGACGYTSAFSDDGDYAVAQKSNERTNCIVVSDDFVFESGNSVLLYDIGSQPVTGGDVRIVKTVINDAGDMQSVYVDGDPFNVTEGVTALAHTALKNGTTRGVGGHTGAMSTSRGTVAFKYRNIENLWGNTYVYIDNVIISGREILIENRDGTRYKMAFLLPDAQSEMTDACIIKALGYDAAMPQVMLPEITGGGATISTYYGDAYTSDGEGDKVLHFGGSWSSKAGAGLFSYVAASHLNETHTNTSGRMMFINE